MSQRDGFGTDLDAIERVSGQLRALTEPAREQRARIEPQLAEPIGFGTVHSSMVGDYADGMRRLLHAAGAHSRQLDEFADQLTELSTSYQEVDSDAARRLDALGDELG